MGIPSAALGGSVRLQEPIALGGSVKLEEEKIIECTICTDVIPENLAHSKLDCRHEFHTKCIILWFEKHSTCPNCRDDSSLSTKRIIYIQDKFNDVIDFFKKLFKCVFCRSPESRTDLSQDRKITVIPPVPSAQFAGLR